MLTFQIAIPNAIGVIVIGILERKIKLANFEKIIIDSDSSLPKAVVLTLDISSIFSKEKPFLDEKS
jgi:hypothetical protein